MKFQARSGKRVVKVSKCGETYIDFYKLYEEYDPFLTSGGAESNSAWVTEVIIFSRLWNLYTISKPDSSWHLLNKFNQIKRADSLLKLFRSYTQSDEIFSRCGLQCLTAETRNSATDKWWGGHFQVSQQLFQIFILCTCWQESKGLNGVDLSAI